MAWDRPKGLPGGSQEGPRRAPRRLPGGSQEAPRGSGPEPAWPAPYEESSGKWPGTGQKGSQEAPRRVPRRLPGLASPESPYGHMATRVLLQQVKWPLGRPKGLPGGSQNPSQTAQNGHFGDPAQAPDPSESGDLVRRAPLGPLPKGLPEALQEAIWPTPGRQMAKTAQNGHLEPKWPYWPYRASRGLYSRGNRSPGSPLEPHNPQYGQYGRNRHIQPKPPKWPFGHPWEPLGAPGSPSGSPSPFNPLL